MLRAKFDGTSYNIGYKHGKLFKKEVYDSILTHCSFKISKEKINKICMEAKEKLEGLFPEAVDELKGIADGSENDFLDILKLNYWEEINTITGQEQTALCTSVGFKNTLVGPIMGKTADIEIEQRNEYMLQWIYPDRGNKILQLGKVGTMKSEVGLNGKGLCIGTSSTMPTDVSGSQIERMTLVRLALQYCNDVDEAIEFFTKYKFYLLGLNILLMDTSGKAAVIEKGIANARERRTNENYIFATNFFVCEDMKPYYDETVWYYKNALARYHTLETILKEDKSEYDVSFMKKILRNHNEGGEICNHNENLDTYYASIIIPSKLTMQVCDGRPCETEFVEYSLDKPISV